MNLKYIHLDELKGKGKYNIVSLEVFNHIKFSVTPFERKIGKSIFEIINEYGTGDIVKRVKKDYELENCSITKTAIQFMEDIFVWEIDKEYINFDIACDCGFGVIEQDGKFYLFNSNNAEDFETLMFEVYLTIVVDKYYNSSIAKMLKNNVGAEKLINRLQHTNNFNLYQELSKAINSKHGGDNIVYIDFGSGK